ncbi:conserved hypothetical protein [Vibrio crassostreae]|nr:conserved hypothetical protein [Vibrio crassostreae]CAK1933116.1 conserved hypothetical protein [Vibrio crassostreae]CAK1933181.1 conserved hypothetical protein [Vibrio crassostreae]CAK1938823.1 conserved hypothetical protein [Vibrio crassostreae]CAK1944285.1 conserved hypothetical protein [Vibrio crassostreae]
MLFWTPDIPCELNNWLNSATDRTLYCEVNPWNCAGSSEFETRIAENAQCLCIPITIRGDQVEDIIHTIWQYVSPNKSWVGNFVNKNNEVRREQLRRQIASGELPDLGIYDCADLLSRIDTTTVLCIRTGELIPKYLLAWVDYMIRYTSLKIIILHPEAVHKGEQFKHLQSLTLPELTKSSVLDTCMSAVYRLTGKHMQRCELDSAFALSNTLNEFISIVQTSIVAQCTLETALSPTGLRLRNHRFYLNN